MDAKTLYAAVTVAAVWVLSYLLRALPFMLFGRGARPPAMVDYIGRVLSPAAVGMLVVYCLVPASGGADLTAWRVGAEIAATLTTLAVQYRWRNPLLSITLGTVLYMLLVQYPLP